MTESLLVSNELLIVAVISPDRSVQDSIASALAGHADIGKMWRLTGYPDSAAIAGF